MLYDEIVRTRNRLADLPEVTSADLESVLQALHEVIWFLITPPRSVETPLKLSEEAKQALLDAARNRNLDTYVTVIALLARKLALRSRDDGTLTVQLTAINDALDILTFDYRTSKRALLSALRDLRSDLGARIDYVHSRRQSHFRFGSRPELYGDRKNKKERPDAFFTRVYQPLVARGLTQADVRRVDPKYYNVLHVWCTRHHRRLSDLLPATRPRRR